MAEQTLAPCPFCGGEARMHPNNWLSCTLCNIFTDIHDTQSEALAHWNSRASPPSAPVAFDPLEGGCPHCRWLDTNLGRVLDKKCDLHQRIEDLQVDLDIEMQVRQSNAALLNRVCEVIRADGEDDPVIVAQARMEEISALEEGASPPAAVPDGWVLVPCEPTLAMVEAGWIDKEDVNPDDIYRAMISAAPAAPNGWRSVQEDPPPKDGRWILATNTGWHGDCEVLGWHFGAWRRSPRPEIAGFIITHWQPLPAAPTEGSDE